MGWSPRALEGCPLEGRLLYGEGLLLVEEVVVPPAGRSPLCLGRLGGLRALLGLEGGLGPLALLVGLLLLGLALRDVGKEAALSTLPLRLGLTAAFLGLALGDGDLLLLFLE